MTTSEPLLPTPTSADTFTGNLKSSQQSDTTKHSVNLSQVFEHPAYSSSRAVSPANRLVRLALGVERPMTAISGRKCLELFDLQNPNGSSLRTCVAYLTGTKEWYSSRCALTWKPKVTLSNRLLFQLSPSTLRTDETESGLLATPNTMDNMEPKTPKAIAKEMNETRKGRTNFANLKEQIAYGKLLKTPSASEAEGGTMNVQAAIDNGWNPKIKMRDQIGHATGLKLQPNFVEWMMGFPPNWTDLNYPSPNTAKKGSKA